MNLIQFQIPQQNKKSIHLGISLNTIGYQDQTQSITSKPKQILSFRTTQQIKKHHKLEAWKYQPDGKGVID